MHKKGKKLNDKLQKLYIEGLFPYFNPDLQHELIEITVVLGDVDS